MSDWSSPKETWPLVRKVWSPVVVIVPPLLKFMFPLEAVSVKLVILGFPVNVVVVPFVSTKLFILQLSFILNVPLSLFSIIVGYVLLGFVVIV